jgi:glyoxylase-like metal-dependent hydrolase (beta-lactamase superfamily II)
MYLVEGSQKAALLDTGSGIGHIRPLIEKLTDKPLIVILTHGHVDHAMGAPEFEDDTPVYMSPLDNEVHKQHSDLDFRKASLFMVPEEVVSKIEESDYIPVRKKEYLPLSHGDTFDLGDLTLEIYACPGHTPGSVTILIREERALLTGDACNSFTFLFFRTCLSISDYKESLRALKEQTDGKYDTVYVSHGTGDMTSDIIQNVMEVCDDILAGNVDNVPFEFMGEKSVIAKAMTPEMTRVDGKIGNIVYDPAHI